MGIVHVYSSISIIDRVKKRSMLMDDFNFHSISTCASVSVEHVMCSEACLKELHRAGDCKSGVLVRQTVNSGWSLQGVLHFVLINV